MRRLMIATAVLVLALALHALTDTSAGTTDWTATTDSTDTSLSTSTTLWTLLSDTSAESSTSTQAGTATSSTDTPYGVMGGNDDEPMPYPKFVVFTSYATNLGPIDNNGKGDVYHFDMLSGSMTRVSVAWLPESDGQSITPRCTSDGQFVVFESGASNLDSAILDDNRESDIFLRDMQAGKTTCISKGWGKKTAAKGGSSQPDITEDGRFIVFSSTATDLTPKERSVATQQIFVHDRANNTTDLVSIGWDGAEASSLAEYPSISSDGRYVAFQSNASNFSTLTKPVGGWTLQVYVRDCWTGGIYHASYGITGSTNGDCKFPRLSGNGRVVAFESGATNLEVGDINAVTDIFVKDIMQGTLTRIKGAGAETDGESTGPSISSDGHYVAFTSKATNLTTRIDDNPGRADIFVHDLRTGTTELASQSSGGIQANGECGDAGISRDGRFVAFWSRATNLVNGAQNIDQVYVRYLEFRKTRRISQDAMKNPGNGGSYLAAMN